MTAEHLRQVAVELERPLCKNEPNAHAIANRLASTQWRIYEAETPEEQAEVLEDFNYDDIGELRADATELILSLRAELEASSWEIYFNRRREFSPYLNVPKSPQGQYVKG